MSYASSIHFGSDERMLHTKHEHEYPAPQFRHQNVHRASRDLPLLTYQYSQPMIHVAGQNSLVICTLCILCYHTHCAEGEHFSAFHFI